MAIANAGESDIRIRRSTVQVAPDTVFVYFGDVTCTNSSNPFHYLRFYITWGDGSAGLWEQTGISRNHSHGALARHCYTSAGTYTADYLIEEIDTNGDLVDAVSGSLVFSVGSADSEYATTDTVAYSNDGDWTGAPDGADLQTWGTDGDYSGMITALNANKRVLFKKGDSYYLSGSDGSSDFISTTGGCLVGAFGSGADPILYVEASTGFYLKQASDGADAPSDVRFENLDMQVETPAPGQSIYGIGSYSSTAFTDLNFPGYVTVNSVSFDGFRIAFSFSNNGGTTATGRIPHNICLHECTVLNAYGNATTTDVQGAGGYGVFGKYDELAILGGHFEDATRGEHLIRIQHSHELTVQHAKIWYAAVANGSLTLRSENSSSTHFTNVTTPNAAQYVIVSDCDIKSWDEQQQSISLSASDAGAAAEIFDVIFERNTIRSHEDQVNVPQMLYCTFGNRVTIRNNCFISPQTSNNEIAIMIKTLDQHNNGKTPDDFWVYGNGHYSATSGNVDFVRIGDAPTGADAPDVLVKNNAIYVPNASSIDVTSVITGEATFDSSNNWSSNSSGNQPPWTTIPPTNASDMKVSSLSDTKLLGQGAAMAELFQDYDAVSRPRGPDSNWDIGPFELDYGTDTPPDTDVAGTTDSAGGTDVAGTTDEAPAATGSRLIVVMR